MTAAIEVSGLTKRLGREVVAVSFCVVVLTVACSSGSGRNDAGSQLPRSIYVVSETSGWTLKEARNPRPDDPISSKTEPTLDWYSEHERFPDPSHSQSVRVSGHDVPIGELERTLTGAQLATRDVGELRGRVGVGPDGPRLVLLPVADDYTLLTLSYELDLDDLVRWSMALRTVDESEWIARGGVVHR